MIDAILLLQLPSINKATYSNLIYLHNDQWFVERLLEDYYMCLFSFFNQLILFAK